MPKHEAKYQVGQIIYHQMFRYLGVVYNVDAVFSASDEWYDQVARSRPLKDKPWYHVLVHEAQHTTYVAEQNLKAAKIPKPILHPLTDHYFSRFDTEFYIPRQRPN